MLAVRFENKIKQRSDFVLCTSIKQECKVYRLKICMPPPKKKPHILDIIKEFEKQKIKRFAGEL